MFHCATNAGPTWKLLRFLVVRWVDRLEPATVSQGLRERVLSQLDDFEPMSDSPSRSRPEGIYPGPVMAALGGNAPRWRPLGGGIRQQVLDKSPEGSLRLLYIPPGMAVPNMDIPDWR